MCLRPVLIYNPEFLKNKHTFIQVHYNKRIKYVVQFYKGFNYGFEMPSAKAVGATLENHENYFGVDGAGFVTNMWLPVNCNKCPECIEQKRSALSVRMQLEQLGHDPIRPLFVTLTYDDFNLPPDGVNTTDLKYFLKRLHINLTRAGYSSYFRHVFFSEYGSLHGRAHYHGILYGLDTSRFPRFLDFVSLLEKSWGKGFVFVKHCDSGVYGYISKYIHKDAFYPVPSGKNPNFWVGSRKNGGLGCKALESDVFLSYCQTDHFPTITIRLDGKCKTVTLPRYIRDKIYPKLSQLVRKDIKDRFNLFVHNWAKLQLLRDSPRADLLSDHEKYSSFPPDLLDKYAFFSYEYDNVYCNMTYEEARGILKFMFSSDVANIIDVLDREYKWLMSQDIDTYSILQQVWHTENYSSRFIERVLQWMRDQPDPADREITINHSNHRHYNFAVKDLQ